MIVTGVEELSKSRSKVFIDGEFAFVLYKGEFRLYHIALGHEVSWKDYQTICEEVLPKRAKKCAMNLLTRRDYTTAKLRDKLRQYGYPEVVVNQALEYVASFHYTDDCRYALDYIRQQQGSRSKFRMERDLQKKGIDRETIDRAWEQWQEEGGTQDEAAMVRELLRKRGFDGRAASPEQRRKEYGFLMRKGFSQECVKNAVFSGIMEDFI